MSNEWYSPINWDNIMTVKLDQNNSMTVTAENTKAIEAKVMFDGFLVYNPLGDTLGNLELVFFPNNWSSKVIESFKDTKWTELPPGRVVYCKLKRNIVSELLNEFILKCYEDTKVPPTPTAHNSILDFVPDPTKKITLLNMLKNDEGNKINLIREIVDKFLKGEYKKESDGMKVESGNVLGLVSESELTFEIRNLYGEPLNPHYYLKKLEVTDMKDTLLNNIIDKPRQEDDNKTLNIKIPKSGGIEYTMMNTNGNVKEPGEPYYKSRLVWYYEFDNQLGTYQAKVKARQGANVKEPDLIKDKLVKEAEKVIKDIWNKYPEYINKYSKIFEVPVELAIAIIYVESGGKNHSIHIERFDDKILIPTYYENLIKHIDNNTAASFTKDTVEKYLKVLGYKTNPGMPVRPIVLKESPKVLPKVTLPIPYDGEVSVGKKGGLNKISWKQLNEMASVCPGMLEGTAITVPSLGKINNKYYYDIIRKCLGVDVAEHYFNSAGGIKLENGKEILSPKGANGKVLITPPSPFEEKAIIKELSEVTWGQFIKILNLFNDENISGIPSIKYTLKPWDKDLITRTYADLHEDPNVQRILGLNQTDSRKLLDKYQKLWRTDLKYEESIPGVCRSKDLKEYLTMEELRKVSKIFPDKISIGIQQTLLNTAQGTVITFVKKRYQGDFFSKNALNPVNPNKPLPDPLDNCIDWLWDYVWNSPELQIILLIAYIKTNCVYFWEGKEIKETKRKGKKRYKIGELMTTYDLPRVAAAYNAGMIKIPNNDIVNSKEEHGSDWGFVYNGNYAKKGIIGLNEAFKLLSKERVSVRLIPDLEENTGMGNYRRY